MYILFVVLVIIAIVGTLIYRKYAGKNSAFHKGNYGEYAVGKILGNSIAGERYVFNNYMLRTENGSSQIDHILLNASGIWVIETKNYSGLIAGTESQREWTQTLAGGKVQNKFYNPVKQNATHAYYIRQIVPKKCPIHTLVVFVDGDISYVKANNVIKINELNKALLNTEAILTSDEIDEICLLLRNNAANGEISAEEHVGHIHNMMSDVKNNICPRCGGDLVLRKGKYGEFYGCSNYPNCKFKKDL